MNYSESIQALDFFVNHEKTNSFDYPEAFKLERMRALAKEFKNPQNAFESILIAGSKGKGSTAAFLSAILRMENWKVGLYTSPHLWDVRERIQVNGLPLSQSRFTEFMERMKKIMNDYSWKKNPPTYFEVLTVMAFNYFKEMKVQTAVLEVGLGGLYDSTNIAPAKVCGLTPISLEHTDKLGKTVSKIAVQKCGIVKGREIVVSAPQSAEAQSVIESACQEREAALFRVGKDIKIFEREFGEDFQKMDVRTPWGDFYNLEIRLLGTHQMENAAQAVGLAMGLGRKTHLNVSEIAIRRGVLDAGWPGRLEKVAQHPRIVLDGAHTVDSIKKMLEGLRRHFEFSGLVAVFGSSGDKDAEGMLAHLAPECRRLVLTQFQNPRAMPCRLLAEKMPTGFKEVCVEPDPPEALKQAVAQAGAEDLILVTGSLFLVAELREAARGFL